MNLTLRHLAKLVAAFAAVGLAFEAGRYVLDTIVSRPSNNLDATIVGAFLGAFLTLLGGIALFFGQRYFDRRSKGQSALVRLEHLLNHNLNRVPNNKAMLEGWRRANKKRALYVTGFSDLAADRDLLAELTNIDVINDAFDYFYDCDKLNHDLSVLHSWYGRLHNQALSGSISPDRFFPHMDDVDDELVDLAGMCDQIDEKGRGLAARVRVVLRRRRGLFGRLIHSGYTRADRRQFADERRKVDAETKEISTVSKLEISAFREKGNES